MDSMQIKVCVVAYPDRQHLVMRYRHPFTRKYLTKSANTASRRDAEKAAAKWEAELQAGRYQAPSNISWSAFRERYESEVVPGFAEKTGSMINTVFNTVEAILHPDKVRDLNASRLSYLQGKLREGKRAEPTIRTYLAHLVSALGWAEDVGLLNTVPKVQKPKRAKAGKVMKGRPVTAEEFDRMLAKVESVVGRDGSASWQHYLYGLWWSGLRLTESLDLYWDRQDRLCVDLSSTHAMLRIPGELEKGNRNRLLPIAPEFETFLLATPIAQRDGRVFQPVGLRIKGSTVDVDWASRVISRVGKAADVKVNTHPKTGKIKFASAHDLRRSFGERWALKIMPQVLKELMRHESIETTMMYYVGHNADLTAERLWAAFRQDDSSLHEES